MPALSSIRTSPMFIPIRCEQNRTIVTTHGLKISCHASIKDLSFRSHVASRGTFLTFRVSLFPSVVASTFYFAIL